MKTMITHRTTWLRGLLALLVCTPLLLALPACTDLDEEPFGVITPDQFFNTEAEFLAEPYRGSDAYVTDGQYMAAMVSTFEGTDLVMAEAPAE